MGDFIRRLTPKQQKFVDFYIIFENATEAARRAGYREKWATKIGPKLIGMDRIQEAINAAARKTITARNITKGRVLAELARIGFSNLDDLATWGERGVKLRDSAKVGRHKKAAVQEISQKSGNTEEIKIKLHDKVRALDTLAKYLGLDQAGANEDGTPKNVIQLKYALNPKKQTDVPE